MEDQRLIAVPEVELLTMEPESEFDELVRLSASICGTPISAIWLLDEAMLRLIATVGLAQQEMPRDISFCDWTVRGQDLFLVEDTTLDTRFAQIPAVVAEHGIRFYAGVPVHGKDGLNVGTL